MDETEIYKIENYTERELFEILDINNPTDRELETSILKNVRQYEKDRAENPKSARLWRFFNDMYKRFFDVDSGSDEEIEGFADASTVNKKPEDLGAQQITPQTSDGKAIKDNADLKNTSTTTHNIEYVKDNLNPIKRETMFKMISIDSQFRDDANVTSATSFTMNLSSSIENVVSIKLYSIQIPYTWYMVNDGFGSNFFYIKGNSPGMNNGNHDIQVTIESGNYTQAEMMNAINASIQNLANSVKYVTDVSFGKTRAFYNATNAKVRIAVDLKKTYTEVDYRLYFPNWTSPNVSGAAKNDSLPSFLGFNFENYYINTVYGNWRSFIGNTFAAESTVANYKLVKGVNDYFRVIQYVGPNVYVPGVTTILKEININFSSALTNDSYYSRDQLYSNLKTQIASNLYFDTEYSDIKLKTVTDETYEWYGYNHYELVLKLYRNKTVNLLNTKIVVKFPDEIEDAGNGFYGNNFIWTGPESCFRFDNSYNEISEIISETETLFTNYVVGANDYITFNCTKQVFNVPENSYSAKVVQSSINGYLLDEYTFRINESLKEMNTASVTPTKLDGVFSINDSINLNNTFFTVLNAIPSFQIDMAKTFDQSTYIIDLSGSFFVRSPFFFPNTVANLTETNFTLSKRYGFVGNYKISAFDKIVLYPKTTGGIYGNGFGNQNQAPIEILLNPPFGNEFNGSFEQIATHLKDVFEAIVDPETGENILMNVELLSKASGNNVDASFNFRISKNLTEKDYQMNFETDSIGLSNPWRKLNFTSPYELSEYLVGNVAVVRGNGEVFQNTIEVRENYNQFQLIPYYDGVYDADGFNTVTITIPTSTSIGSNYTRDSLIAEINKQLDLNNLTKNSEMTLFNIGQKQYSKMRITIDKTYLPRDYKLVFYDPISFSYCGVGSSGGRSIRTITWESTLGWLLGFHTYTEYILGDFLNIDTSNLSEENYRFNLYNSGDTNDFYENSQNLSSSNDDGVFTEKICVIGDSILNTNLYNYFLIVLDDYIQNHVNDGLVTISSLEKDVSLPTYASRVTFQCDPVSGKKVAVSASNRENMNLSSKQLYAMNQVLDSRRNKERSYSVGPVLRDVFALIPLKLSGLAFGSTYMEFGGTLQNQDRKYFGPVRIQKFSVKLMNDKGEVVNLNGGNWSFTIICEIMVANK